MAFVGLITKKDKPTGVSLMAKVVTENKKKSAEKVFKVSVKASGLDDFSCCVLDHAAVVDKINSSQDMTQLIDDMSLIYSGVHGTTISYRIIDIDEPKLSAYLGEDGKIHGRPKYGEGNATGYIEITVVKNAASLVSRIQASVKAITPEEVLNDATFSQSSMWTFIRGENDPYQQGNEWSGHNNISKPLNLITTKSVNTLSTNPVNIAWSVSDETLSYAGGIYSDPRIDATSGAVFRPSYKDACTLVGVSSNVKVEVVGNDASALQNRVRIGGLILTASLNLGDITKKVVFNCSTISKYLTNQEVLDVVLDNIYITTSDGVQVRYKETSDSTFHSIVAPAGGGQYTLKAFSKNAFQTFDAPELKLNAGQIIGVSITNNVLAFNGSMSYPDSGLLNTAFGGGFKSDSSDTYADLVVDFAQIKDANSSMKEFACGATIEVSGYSSTGEVSAGNPVIIKRHAQFKIDTSAMTTPPVAS